MWHTILHFALGMIHALVLDFFIERSKTLLPNSMISLLIAVFRIIKSRVKTSKEKYI